MLRPNVTTCTSGRLTHRRQSPVLHNYYTGRTTRLVILASYYCTAKSTETHRDLWLSKSMTSVRRVRLTPKLTGLPQASWRCFISAQSLRCSFLAGRLYSYLCCCTG